MDMRWNKLQDLRGSAEPVPKDVRALTSKKVDTRNKAFANLADRLATGGAWR